MKVICTIPCWDTNINRHPSKCSVCVCVCFKLCKTLSRLVDLCDLTSKRLNVCTGTNWAQVCKKQELSHTPAHRFVRAFALAMILVSLMLLMLVLKWNSVTSCLLTCHIFLLFRRKKRTSFI